MTEGSYGGGFEDADAQGSGKEQLLSFRYIIMLHLQAILAAQRVEWHGGYWEEHHETMPGTGLERIRRVYVLDTRQTYINAVVALYNVVCPYLTAGKKKGIDHQAAIEEALRPVEEGVLHEPEAAGQSALIMATHRLLRVLMAFLKSKNYFEAVGSDDV